MADPPATAGGTDLFQVHHLTFEANRVVDNTIRKGEACIL